MEEAVNMSKKQSYIIAAAIISLSAFGVVYGVAKFGAATEAEPQKMNIEVHIADKHRPKTLVRPKAVADSIKRPVEDVEANPRVKMRVTYKDRFDTTKDTKIIVWSWEGGATVKKEQLAQTIEAVQERLSIVPKGSADHVALLMETSAVESSRGYIVRQVGGPARGIFQMEPTTERCMRSWLKDNFPSIHDEVMAFYDKKKSPDWNRTHNVPYNVAMSTAYYWRRMGDSLAENITTLEDRAKVWKTHYNTYLGKGSIAGYIRKAEKYL